MTKRRRGHQAPPQGRQQAIPVAVPDLRQQANARKQQEMQIRARIEGLAAEIFCRNISAAFTDQGLDEEIAGRLCINSADAALLFANRIWGVQAERQVNTEAPPVTALEDDDEE